ncbi:hypothetical protein ASF53_16800 [Methylobacterium sp. Leaf123]|uniref:DUF6602 domain-containing protein n=1 Tax=Methylobacterium sp. Leaf123 TaxID=1736264 RepID=UPI0006FF874D|nr:DUF6602 domain-containing protein [Methylobacterium sp. Leaf123]KQQ11820.1 hypothetical protein ASF53_16800 [Methylobacterium sp. Leaf123]
MSGWSLPVLLAGLHDDIQGRLERARKLYGHPVAKGEASETVWLELLKYLPSRYQSDTAFVVDSDGNFSDQIDIVIFDRQYTPFILKQDGHAVIPAESVYAVFEAKQAIDAGQVAYAQAKIASVRKLRRTSLPIPHAGGTYPPKPPHHIMGGLLTFESAWAPALGDPLTQALSKGDPDNRLDLGCVAAHGHFARDDATGNYIVTSEGRPATAFLFELIARLQSTATVPMIDIRAYAKWLNDPR